MAQGMMKRIDPRRPVKAVVILAATLVAAGLTSSAAQAASSGPPFAQCPAIGASPSCEILIQINTDHSVTVLADPGVEQYDGSDDTLVGIQNNSSSPVAAITVTGPGSDLSGFDGDGICTYTFTGDSYCDAQQIAGTDPYDYEGPDNTFVTAASEPDSAEVDFTSALAPHGSSYFSLEGALTSASLTARLGHLQDGYVALGDSYSSGEGNPPFIQGTDTAGDYCHRSAQAYPELLGTALGVTPEFYACSGAVAANITTATQYPGEQAPQDQRPGVDSSAALVTVTIGGNNADFSDVLTSCIEQKLEVNAENAATSVVASWLGLNRDPSCVDSKSFVASENTKIDGVQSQAASVYTAIKSDTGPLTSVIAADYPHIFPTAAKAQSCRQLSPYLTAADQRYFNTDTDRLDGGLQAAAAAAGVNFVDVRGPFAGHGICGAGGSYLNALSIASGNGGGCTYSLGTRCIIPGLPVVGSFHPNASGHADGYEPAFQSYIGTAKDKTPAGYPVNPAPETPAAKSMSAMTSGPAPGSAQVAVGTLMIQSAASSKCQPGAEGTYRPGDHLAVTGSGFAPGAVVRLFLTPPRVSFWLAQSQLAVVRADASGQVSATVSIPRTAIGFTEPGAKAGIIFVDALGLGSGGAHVDDVAMAGLTTHLF
jgi:hypothetical protein